MEEHEEFDINAGDFEAAMNPGRSFRRQTKDQAIYGMWADSDDEDERPGFSKGSRKKADYSAPVQFISGGIKVGNKMEGEEEEEIDERPTFASKRPKTIFTKEAGGQVLAGMRGGQFQEVNAAEWTKKSGKGDVIMQMMQKMGYVHGKGLGANKQGIVEPIEAKVRPGRAAVGGYGREQKGPKFGESAAEAQARITGGPEPDASADLRQAAKGQSWKKSNAGKKGKVQYKTVDDIVAEGAATRFDQLSGLQGAGMKIIDMTGPEQKVYNDFSSYTKRTKTEDFGSTRQKFDIPELTHNLNTLMNVTEEEILKNERELRFLKDQNFVLQEDQKRLDKEATQAREEVARMNEVTEIIKRFQRKSVQGGPTLEDCKELITHLRADYAVEYKLFGLDAIAMTSVLPIIKQYFAEWDPLDPDQGETGLEMLEEWRDVLAESKTASMFDSYKKESNTLPAFDVCIWEAWMPKVRRAALSWNPAENGPAMLNLVGIWLAFLPRWIGENLLEQVLIPRIKEQVDLWDPSSDRIPIDSWLLPWREIMGDRLLLVYPTIRQKLAQGLKKWRPGDRSAIASIRPWKDAFVSGSMHSFLAMNIVPKLERALQTMNINTTAEFEYIELFDWMEMIHVDVICQMMIKSFFPRFYEQLCMRLTHPSYNLAIAQEYYKSWKNLLPPPLTQLKPIRDELTRCLMAINQVQKGLTLPFAAASAPPTMAYPPGNYPPNSQFFRR
ncbi:GC-rich sequence DNA-binding factor-like protein domain-containing protein [Ditylenchus destructor]|uniref:GC-rich sequence DNA-binding factor-like protein domain-containing protein n=1 Tax=Ditylenchus destructor TaxID=166010 RepID=A0AAD4N2U2_9BILA|nr:GC-rich sequence DNA-binding factor-like protein domain-containing protein [Ditylenchus destructor]